MTFEVVRDDDDDEEEDGCGVVQSLCESNLGQKSVLENGISLRCLLVAWSSLWTRLWLLSLTIVVETAPPFAQLVGQMLVEIVCKGQWPVLLRLLIFYVTVELN